MVPRVISLMPLLLKATEQVDLVDLAFFPFSFSFSFSGIKEPRLCVVQRGFSIDASIRNWTRPGICDAFFVASRFLLSSFFFFSLAYSFQFSALEFSVPCAQPLFQSSWFSVLPLNKSQEPMASTALFSS